MSEHILIGKTLTAVHIADDKGAIKFDVNNGETIVARADGDCCSHTWIENIEDPDVLIGTPILSVENLTLRDDERVEEEGDYIQYYGVKITTQKGVCTIDYRNSSNGYYGGSLVWPNESYFYGGVFGQNISKEFWKQVTHAQ